MISAYVLHRWLYQEHSLIVELFTRQEGRVRVIAKGARRSKKGQAAALQPFSMLNVAWVGQRELKTLTAVELADISQPLQGDFLYCGFYMNELLQRLVPEQAVVGELFDDYHSSLQLLREGVAIEPVLRRFEWLLLQHLQLDFDWNYQADDGSPIAPQHRYYFDPSVGFLPVVSGREPTPHYDGDDILKMAKFEVTDERLLRQFKWLMRAALRQHLGPKPLQSRALFAQRQLPTSR